MTRAEQQVLAEKMKDLSLSARVHQGYRVIEEVRRGRAPLAAADRIGCTFSVAYDWIRRFNESGFSTFEAVPNPKGRPPIPKAQQLRDLVDNASWLNLIEAQFGVTKRFALTDTDDPDHHTRRRRITPYIRNENRQAGTASHPLAHLLTIRDIKL